MKHRHIQTHTHRLVRCCSDIVHLNMEEFHTLKVILSLAPIVRFLKPERVLENPDMLLILSLHS